MGDHAVTVNGHSYPYVRKARAEAGRAATALTRACGFTVDVHPVLAFVDAVKVTVVPSLHDVRVIRRHREIAALKRLTGVLTPEAIDTIHTAARDRRTWQNI